MMVRSTLIPVLILLSLSCKSQIRQGDHVIMPIEVYRSYRTAILLCDTMKIDANKTIYSCDSILKVQDKLIKNKDSIIVNLNSKVILKDSIISLMKPKSEPKIHTQAWIGGVIGAFLMALILK